MRVRIARNGFHIISRGLRFVATAPSARTGPKERSSIHEVRIEDVEFVTLHYLWWRVVGAEAILSETH